jgi:hypothetical protein
LWFKDPLTPPHENNGRSFGDPVDVMFRGGELPPNSIIVDANFYDNPWPSDESGQQIEWDKRVILTSISTFS